MTKLAAQIMLMLATIFYEPLKQPWIKYETHRKNLGYQNGGIFSLFSPFTTARPTPPMTA
jgi:hypothetical protein